MNQHANPPFTPPRWLIPWITRAHVWLYEASDGRLGNNASGMPHLLLYTVGRRSGASRVVCLPYWLDGSEPVIVASFAGSPSHPAWYLNLCDKSRNAEVQVRDGRRTYLARPEILAGEDRAKTWLALAKDRPFYLRYQAATRREIPLIRLERS